MFRTSKKKKKKKKSRQAPAELVRGLPDEPSTGLPAKDSIREVVDFVSPKKERYKIFKTTETDSYDPVADTKKKRRPKP